MSTLYTLQERYFVQIVLSLTEQHVFLYKLTQLLSLGVDVSGDWSFTFGEGEAVGQQHLMHPFHHGQHIFLPEVALRSPSPSLPRYLPQNNLHSSHNSLELMSSQQFFSKTDEPLPRLVLAEVRIADVKKGRVAGQSLPKHYHYVQFAVQLRGLHFEHQHEADSGGIDIGLIQKGWVLLGRPSLRVFVDECPVEHADLLLLSL